MFLGCQSNHGHATDHFQTRFVFHRHSKVISSGQINRLCPTATRHRVKQQCKGPVHPACTRNVPWRLRATKSVTITGRFQVAPTTDFVGGPMLLARLCAEKLGLLSENQCTHKKCAAEIGGFCEKKVEGDTHKKQMSFRGKHVEHAVSC